MQSAHPYRSTSSTTALAAARDRVFGRFARARRAARTGRFRHLRAASETRCCSAALRVVATVRAARTRGAICCIVRRACTNAAALRVPTPAPRGSAALAMRPPVPALPSRPVRRWLRERASWRAYLCRHAARQPHALVTACHAAGHVARVSHVLCCCHVTVAQMWRGWVTRPGCGPVLK